MIRYFPTIRANIASLWSTNTKLSAINWGFYYWYCYAELVYLLFYLYNPPWRDETHKNWLPGRLIRRESHWISNPLLTVPIRNFSITYDLRRSAIFIWVVGCFATLFSKSRRAYIWFVWVCMLYSFRTKKAGKGGRRKGRTISEIFGSAGGNFETLKHATRRNPNTVICTTSTYKWMIFKH